MKEIALTQGKVAIVDDEDHEALAMYKWQAYRRRKTFYVKRSLPRVDGKRPSEHMHQVVFARKIGRPPDVRRMEGKRLMLHSPQRKAS